MKYYSAPRNPRFVGREPYWQRLKEIDQQHEAAIIVVYGRYGVGKTELVEQFFRGRPMLKFEGVEPKSGTVRTRDEREKQRQLQRCVQRLGHYVERQTEYRLMRVETWTDFFELLVPLLEKDPVVLYLDELQWLSSYTNELLSELKPWWDDVLRHNPRLRVVISGSAPAYIVNQFLASSAMYNRSNHMIKLEPFNLAEIQQFLKTGHRETMLAAIAVGGIPEYLKQLASGPSVFVRLCERSFRPGGFFREEKERLFVSSLRANHYYEAIIDYLARERWATRQRLYKALTQEDTASPGGSFTAVLDELVKLDFVKMILPVTTKIARTTATRRPAEPRNARYIINDEYLQFYYRFIDRRIEDIDSGRYEENPTQAISLGDFYKLLGFSFERWCLRNERLITRRLAFGGVNYAYGAWYEKDSAQIDVMYIRADNKIMVCEVKFNSNSDVPREVMRDVQRKIDHFLAQSPRYARYTIETVLITTEPVTDAIRNEAYFTHLVTSEELIAVATGKPVH